MDRSPLALPPFRGHSTDDPDEYLEAVQVVANQAAGDDKDATNRFFFRSGLAGGAKEWYADLPKEVRSNWPALQEQFVAKFDQTRCDPSFVSPGRCRDASV